MVDVAVTNPGTPRYRPNIEEAYMFLPVGTVEGGFDKIYTRSKAKTRFTQEIDHDYSRSWARKSDGSMEDRNIAYFLKERGIYKFDADTLEWVCIFEPDSEAGHAFIRGDLTGRELRDSIDW